MATEPEPRNGRAKGDKPFLCPSAQPDMEGAVAFGIVGGDAQNPRVGYLAKPIPVTPALLKLAEPVEPTEVFRFGAPCAESGCQHFSGDRCELGHKLAREVAVVSERLPRCRLRPSCRWWHEQGKAACMRCRLVVTTHYTPSSDLRTAADPERRAGEQGGGEVPFGSWDEVPERARSGERIT